VTDVLDLIGEELQRAAQRQVQRSRAHRRARRVTGWLLAVPHDGRRRAWWRSPRPLGVVLAALLTTGAAAYGAAQLIGIGSPAPPSHDPTVKLFVTAHTELLGVRAADPAGGPPWGIQVAFETHTANPYGLPGVCVGLGRVVGGRIGYIGEDGAFHNDGLFHAASLASGLDEGIGDCVGPSAHTKVSLSNAASFINGEIVASGRQGCKLVPPPLRLPRRYRGRPTADLSPAARARLVEKRLELAGLEKRLELAGVQARHRERQFLAQQVAVLRADGPAALALARRAGVSVATLRNADAHQLALLGKPLLVESIASCPPQAVRSFWQGFAGTDATAITFVGHGVRRTEQVTPSQNGAYLFVLAGPNSAWRGWYAIVTCRNGRSYAHALTCPYQSP
jgi:hypothetical protein